MLVRLCPKCKSERPASELICQGEFADDVCNWDLGNIPPMSPDRIASSVSPAVVVPPSRQCQNGHPFEDGDLICPECGVEVGADDIGPNGGDELPRVDLPGDWQLVDSLAPVGEIRERFLVRNAHGLAVLTLYREGSEPDSDVQNVLRNMDVDHIPTLLDAGRFRERSYEVFEYITGGCLDDIELDGHNRDVLNKVVDEIGRALDDFAQVGLRHRDLRPHTILVRQHDDLDLVIDGFGSARLSDFDLDIESPLEITRYMAPEAIAGGVAAASDWWSLGMILLEKITRGECFEGINEQAFLISVFANGVPLPDDLDSDIELLLRGLLALDREARWQWDQVKDWLDGKPVDAPQAVQHREIETGPSIKLDGTLYRSTGRYALAASERGHWDEACEQFFQGALLNWLDELHFDRSALSAIRSVRSSNLDIEDQFSITLKILNRDMPLIRRGEIISPAWLIQNPMEGYRLISGQAPDLLRDLDAEQWLAQLKRRETRVRDVAKFHEVDLNEDRLQILAVATSVAQLKAQWDVKRRLFPDTDHHGVATLMDRRQVAEEDLIILCAAKTHQFRSTQEVIAEATELAERAGANEFDQNSASKLLDSNTKLEILKAVEERIRDFATCAIDALDKWADQFRLENRIGLSRAIVLHSVPEERWTKPPRHAYVRQLVSFFEQKLSLSIRQGPLSRMTIAKSSAKIDLTELESTGQSAEALLNRVLKRSEMFTTLDPQPFIQNPLLERRIRNLDRHTTLYKRDTGIDGLYMGFPFLLLQLPNRNTKPRIAPVLLWPVKMVAEVGQQGQFRLAFDNDRAEVRINPVIESYVGTKAFDRWKDATKSLLDRNVSAKDIIDQFGGLVTPRGRELQRLPGINTKVEEGPGELVSSAVLFHVKFMGQAIVEELRKLRGQGIEGSALESLLRLSGSDSTFDEKDVVPEIDNFLVVNSDPSQEKAVVEARKKPGLVISGPPGTGKSQTIVNIIADAIGREKTLLVVCQKQAALEVVHKRLEAEGLGDRVLLVTDENKDRKAVVKLVREQVEGLLQGEGDIDRIERSRNEVAAQLNELEKELDAQHQSIHEVNEISGLSYRDLIAQLVAIEEGDRPTIDCLALRNLLSSMDEQTVARARERCSAISRLWLEAQYEDSPLAVLSEFGWDTATINAFKGDFSRFSKAELERQYGLRRHATPIRLESSTIARQWLNGFSEKLAVTSESDLATLRMWIDLFKGKEFPHTVAGSCLSRLIEIKDSVEQLNDSEHDVDLLAITAPLKKNEFGKLLDQFRKVTRPVGVFGKLNPVRLVRRWLLTRWLNSNDLESGEVGLLSCMTHLELEKELRPIRTAYEKVIQKLGLKAVNSKTLTLSSLHAAASKCIVRINSIRPLAELMHAFPIEDKATQVAKTATAHSMQVFQVDVEAACEQADARIHSLNALSGLENWMLDDWRAKQDSDIRASSKDMSDVANVNSALPTLAAYQQFRVRSTDFDKEQWAVLKALRSVEAELLTVPKQDLESEVKRVIDREQRLFWKEETERRSPNILADRSEIESKIQALAAADQRMRLLNQKKLANGVNTSRIADAKRWEDITRLSGVRMKRLREFIRLGVDLGLTSVRPVWLMNPEVVSRVLPLTRGLFDVVVFDEASQMPVEYSIPALYRGSVAIVSGDEKQLPPTAFFSSKVESDEAEFGEGDLPEEDATEEEREALEEVWDRREIKSCPDLLALANSSLPRTLLEIHYRSQYRELIAFSNHSFYAGRLHVPAQHPKEKVLLDKPIQVMRVDGLYEHQMNKDEAIRVVKVVEKAWSWPHRPTIGVVTFNRKQADLILEEMETYAKENAQFRRAYAQESERVVDGEDMRFFVKNVENVQGDERDVMIFSTTFGWNPQGTFRRSFGVLGQKGGERRLNVAITRAKRKIVIVTSMPVKEISDFLVSRRKPSTPRDYLQAYLHYAEQLSRGQLDTANSLLARLNASSQGEEDGLVQLEDGFSNTVASYIADTLRIKPVPANDGTAFGIDYAIEDPKTGLFGIGIECDSPNHSLLSHARSREIWRRKVLGQSIQKIHRVSSYGWYHHREKEQNMLKLAIYNALSQEQVE